MDDKKNVEREVLCWKNIFEKTHSSLVLGNIDFYVCYL